MGRRGFPGVRENAVRIIPINVREGSTGGAFLSRSVGAQSEFIGTRSDGHPLTNLAEISGVTLSSPSVSLSASTMTFDFSTSRRHSSAEPILQKTGNVIAVRQQRPLPSGICRLRFSINRNHGLPRYWQLLANNMQQGSLYLCVSADRARSITRGALLESSIEVTPVYHAVCTHG